VEALLPLILLGALLLLVMSRGRAQRRHQHELQSSLAPGQQVMTTAGLFARLSAVEDDVVVLEIAPGVRCRYARGAIARVVPDEARQTPTGDPMSGPAVGGPAVGGPAVGGYPGGPPTGDPPEDLPRHPPSN
jgi:preprotein translocase subunit YajC